MQKIISPKSQVSDNKSVFDNELISAAIDLLILLLDDGNRNV